MDKYLKQKKPNLFFQFNDNNPQGLGQHQSNQAQSQQDLMGVKNQLASNVQSQRLSQQQQKQSKESEKKYDYQPSLNNKSKKHENNSNNDYNKNRHTRNNSKLSGKHSQISSKYGKNTNRKDLQLDVPVSSQRNISQHNKNINNSQLDNNDVQQSGLKSNPSSTLLLKQQDKYDIRLISKNPLMEASQGFGDLHASHRGYEENKKGLGAILQSEKQFKHRNTSRYGNQKNFEEGGSPTKIKSNANNEQQNNKGEGQDFDEEFLKLAKKRSLMRKQLPALQQKSNQKSSGIEIITQESLPKSLSKKKLTKQGILVEASETPAFLQKNLYPRSTVSGMKIINNRSFIQQIISPHQLFSAVLQRDRTSCTNRFYPKYTLYLSDGVKFILSGQRKSFRATSNYVISSQQDNYNQNQKCYAGLLVSNFSGSIFNLYDDGIHPQQSLENHPNKNTRQLIATIHYGTTSICSSSPRQVTVYILKKPYKYLQLKGSQPNKQQINLKQLYQLYPDQNKNKIYKAQSKKPNYNEYKKCYTMNFYGKMGMSSVKNMILIGEDEREIMLFAKSDSNQFCLDVTYPLEPRIAMGIVLSGFDFKWVCE